MVPLSYSLNSFYPVRFVKKSLFTAANPLSPQTKIFLLGLIRDKIQISMSSPKCFQLSWPVTCSHFKLPAHLMSIIVYRNILWSFNCINICNIDLYKSQCPSLCKHKPYQAGFYLIMNNSNIAFSGCGSFKFLPELSTNGKFINCWYKVIFELQLYFP